MVKLPQWELKIPPLSGLLTRAPKRLAILIPADNPVIKPSNAENISVAIPSDAWGIFSLSKLLMMGKL
jgi:hypothetical protein